ncbi:hypothetical protein QQX98_010158, partial [Neonectria punicea]
MLRQDRKAFNNALEVKYRQGVLNHTRFLPTGAIQLLVTEDRVRRLLPGISSDLLYFACNTAPKIFLILWDRFNSDFGDLLDIFFVEGFTDANLPLQDFRPICKEFDGKECTHSSALDVFHREDWDRADIGRFLEAQWTFIAHVFTKNDLKNLESGCILPFTTMRNTFKHGTFGNVYEVTIPIDHLDPTLIPKNLTKKDVEDIPAALKELSSVPADANYDIQQAWTTEADALFATRSLKTDHVVRIIGAFSQSQGEGRRYYIVLEWAQGGNLVDFWRNNGTQSATLQQIRQYLQQLTGLCQALEELHGDDKHGATNPAQEHLGGSHVRHGDLKPANILIFPTPKSDWLGVLKIADLGVAKIHSQDTNVRPAITKTTSATRQYLAPEMAREINKKRSRRFDIWSMGCIIFESVVWLLYGKKGLDRFWENEQQPQCSEPHSLFFTLGKSHTRVNYVVKGWISHILAEDERLRKQPRTLIGDLLALVRDELLVVELDKPSGDSNGSVRSSATHLHSQIRRITKQADKDEYLATVGYRSQRKLPGDRSSRKLATPPAQQFNSFWKSLDDRKFVCNLMQSHGQEFASLFRPISSNLCDRCSLLDISQNSFNLQESLVSLRKTSPTCNFCRLILASVERYQICHADADEVRVKIRRVGSELEINDTASNTSLPILTICKGPDQSMGPQEVRVGLPTLPPAKSPAYFTLIRGWIQDCDKNHHECKPDSSLGPNRLPTRLIKIREGIVCVHEVNSCDRHNPEMFQYTALSHRWGDNGIHQHFKTTSDNIADRRTGVPTKALPSMFQDAIKVTCELGLRYIWIDSMCIIQEGELCDFETEAKHMETVFRLAYCVIAASRAAGTSHEFLGARPERTWVALPTSSGEEFLGDANFPNVATNSTKGGRIQLIKSLYKKYSKLEFTNDFDRPLAIAGLEQRLIRAFDTKGGYGVFQLYLGRTLLWKRDSDKALRKIDFPPEQKFQVPSWSWMACSGPIDFVDTPFKEVDWNKDLGSPWASAGDWASSTGDSTFSNVLHAVAYDIDLKGSSLGIVFDSDAPRAGTIVKCVVVGKEKRKNSAGLSEQRHFALIVAPRPAARKAY